MIETDPARSTAAGGTWWDVPIAEVSANGSVRASFSAYRKQLEDGEDKK